MKRLVVLLALAASSCLYAVQPPLHIAGKDVVVTVPPLLPGETPKGILIFLHGLSPEPWIEEQEGIAATEEFGAEHGYVVVVPFGDRVCAGNQRCWPTHPGRSAEDDAKFAAVVPDLDRVCKGVERVVGARGLDRFVVGYSNGGFFLAAAVERGLLSSYTRVGIAAGGPVGDPTTTTTPTKPSKLLLAAFDDDEFQGPSMLALRDRFADRGVVAQWQQQPGAHIWSAEHAVTFLSAFLDVPLPVQGAPGP